VPDFHDYADVATILTFLGASYAYGTYLLKGCRHRSALELYLSEQRDIDSDKLGRDGKPKQGLRSALQISRDIGLTEDEVIRASFHNDRIRRRVGIDEETGIANRLLFGISK
jgi:hypothetical protein